VSMMKTVEARLPEFDASKPADSWNEDGPYETMPLSFRAKNKNADDSTKDLYHAVEAWGFRKMPDGKKRICIADPNSTLNNDNCKVYFEIDESEGADPRATYSRWPHRNIGKMMLSPSANGQNGRYMHQLTHACRIKNKDKFYSGCKEVDDVHCGEKDYTTVDVNAVEENVNSSIEKQKEKLREGDQ
ncbi:MAG: hypothetical protein KC493_05495, partial [Bacteriovoracaceae bacterium]|nr:hypothetical protein [Bacteriovoracaceae bacterium]